MLGYRVMATAYPTGFHAEARSASPASSTRALSPEALRPEHFEPYVRQIESEHPGYLASLGVTAAEYAAGMSEPGLTIEESIAAGLMSAMEGRFLQGCATAEDLAALGCSPEEIDLVLEQQRARVCASSD